MPQLNLLKKYPVIVASLALFIMSIGLVAVMALSQQSQDVRQQAYGSCGQAPINTQFRKNASATTPWIDGNVLNPTTGDRVDVNCFAQNGAALLTNGQITGTRNGQPLGTLPGPDGRQVRNYVITQPGTYVFTCTDGAACSNADSFTATGDSLETADEDCTTYAQSDLNQDCQSTIDDYQLFVQDYIQEQN